MATSHTKKPTFREIIQSLPCLDLVLPFTIVLAMAIGILVSKYSPSSRDVFSPSHSGSWVGVSIPLALGMIIMMLPPLCEIEWESLPIYIRKRMFIRHVLYSVILNWVVCPLLMFGLSWMALFNHDEYREGVIMIGLARCIAMVLIWNKISGGDQNLCAVLVVINSILQMALYAPLQVFYCYVITNEPYEQKTVLYAQVAKSVSVFLGVPLSAGLLIRFTFVWFVGKEAFQKRVMPFIAPWALLGFHYTIIVIFISKGYSFLQELQSAFLCFIPLTLYFLISWAGCFILMRFLTSRDENREAADDCECDKQALLKANVFEKRTCGADYAATMTQCFTAASNNFELSLAIAVSLYGNGSKQAIAATFGPLLEIPILLCLALFARYLEHALVWRTPSSNDEH